MKTSRPALPLHLLGCLGVAALGVLFVLVLLLAPQTWQAPAPAPVAPGIDLDVDVHHPVAHGPAARRTARPVRTPAARRAPAPPRRTAAPPAKSLTRR